MAEKTGGETPRVTRRELYERQMRLLRRFLENGAITQRQYHISADDLAAKMGLAEEEKNGSP